MQPRDRSCARFFGVAVIGLCAVSAPAPSMTAQGRPMRLVRRILPPPREAGGRRTGPASCRSQETTLTFEGRALVRLDVGLDGTVDGYRATTGDHKGYLTNAPDLVFPQTADGAAVFAVATYEREKGAAMTVVFPRDASAWNGKVWVTVHGRGTLVQGGQLRPWDKNLDPPIRCATWTSTTC